MPFREPQPAELPSSRCFMGCEAADLAVAQAVEHEREEFARHRGAGLELGPAGGDGIKVGPQLGATRRPETASMAAHRTNLEPALVMGPRITLVSDSRWRGASPAQEVSASALGNRDTSPISATKMAAMMGPTPGIAWIAL